MLTDIERGTTVASVDLRGVLAALPMDCAAGRWLTPSDVAERLRIGLDVGPECPSAPTWRIPCRG